MRAFLGEGMVKNIIIIIQVISLLNFSMWTNPLMAELVGAPTLTTDPNTGLITSTENHKFAKVSDSDMLASITMLAGGVIAGRMAATYRPLTADVGVAGAAGAAFIAGELMSNFKFKGTIKSMEMEVTKTNTGTVNEEQIQRLADLKKSYIEAKNAVSTKKKLQLAAAAGFGIAAVMAQFFTKKEEELLRACQMAFTQGQALLASCPDPNQAVARAQCIECATELTKLQPQILHSEATRQVPEISSIQKESEARPEQTAILGHLNGLCKAGVSSPVVTSVATRVQFACTALVQAEMANQTSGNAQALKGYLKDYEQAPKEMITYSLKFFLPILVSRLFLFSDAQAGWIPLLGLSAATAASFYLITGKTANDIDKYMFIPKYRAIAFAGLGALSFMASKSSDNVIKKINQNIAQVDQILDSLYRLQNGVKAKQLLEKAINLQSIPLAFADYEDFSQDGSVKMPCLAGNPSASGTCPSLEDKVKEMSSFVNLPESLKTTALQATKIGDGLSGSKGISGDLMGKIQDLGSKQSAINKLLKKNLPKKKNLDSKKNTPDTGKFLKGLELANGATIKKSGQTPAGVLAGLGGTPIDSKGADLSKLEDDLANNKSPGAPKDMSAGVPDIGGKKDDRDQDFELKLSGDENGLASSDGQANSDTDKKDEYEMSVGDIHDDGGPTLFELISNRYLTSGYPKLLEEVVPSKN